MISTSDMTNAALALNREGSNLVTRECLTEKLGTYYARRLKAMILDATVPSFYKQAVAEKIEREVDSRFPARIVAQILGKNEDGLEDDFVAIGVPQVVVDLWGQISTRGVSKEAANYELDGKPVRLAPRDLIPNRGAGPAVAILFFPEGAPWATLWDAYCYYRSRRASGEANTVQRLGMAQTQERISG